MFIFILNTDWMANKYNWMNQSFISINSGKQRIERNQNSHDCWS